MIATPTLDQLAADDAALAAEIDATRAKLAELDALIANANADPAGCKDWGRVGGWIARRGALAAQAERLEADKAALQPELVEARRDAQQRRNDLAAARAVLDAVPGWLSDERPFDALDMPLVSAFNLVHQPANVLRVLTAHARGAAALLRAAGEDVPDVVTVTLKLS